MNNNRSGNNQFDSLFKKSTPESFTDFMNPSPLRFFGVDPASQTITGGIKLENTQAAIGTNFRDTLFATGSRSFGDEGQYTASIVKDMKGPYTQASICHTQKIGNANITTCGSVDTQKKAEITACAVSEDGGVQGCASADSKGGWGVNVKWRPW